jgi:hypothetical protein
MQLFRLLFLCTFLIGSTLVFAGWGDGSDNNAGGFRSGNNTGGFGESNGLNNSSGSGFFGILSTDDPPPGGGPGGDPESPDNPDVTDVPLDGGAAILIAIGLGVGGRRIYKKIINP